MKSTLQHVHFAFLVYADGSMNSNPQKYTDRVEHFDNDSKWYLQCFGPGKFTVVKDDQFKKRTVINVAENEVMQSGQVILVVGKGKGKTFTKQEPT